MILDQIADESSRAIRESGITPQAILWPEGLLTFPVTHENRIGRRFQDYVNDWGVPVVTGLVREIVGDTTGRYRNSAVWWSPLVGQRDAIDKVRAIPLIESGRGFWGRRALARIVGEPANGPRVEEARIARPLRGEFTLSPVLCFEVLFPQIVADRRDEQSVAIVNLADDSWVAGEVVDAQLIAAASFRAIEQRLTLVRVSNGGLSVVINRFGESIASLEPDTLGHLFVDVSADRLPSTFEKSAILCPPILAGLVTWSLFPALCRRLERTRRLIRSQKWTVG
jgi:apolipoprotein N-acyltransferase